jgi:uncharacterized protein YbjT (DUF2867 family)
MEVLVHGATGAQGGPVARRLLDRGDAVRVLTRDPQAPAAQRWRAAGARVVAGDLRTGQGLAAASAGVDAVFVQVTAQTAPAAIPGLARTALTAARDARVPHVVLTTSSVVPPAPTGRAAPDARVDLLRVVREVAPHAVVLSPTLLLENFSGPLRPALDSGVVPQGVPADVPVAYTSVEDQAAYAVAALDRPELAGRFLRVAGPDAVTGPTFAAVLGAALGRPLRYAALSPEEVRASLAFLGDAVAAAVADMYAWEGAEGAPLLAPDLAETRAALPVVPTPLAVWAQRALAPAVVPA